MQPRIANPVMTVPGAMAALQKLSAAATHHAGVPEATRLFLALRASQINGCGVRCDMHSRELKVLDEPEERIYTLAAWREASYFSDAERAALALTEAATRLADRSDAVADEVWDEAARHYDEAQLASLVLAIAAINAWNRINATTRQITGEWVTQWIPGAEQAASASAARRPSAIEQDQRSAAQQALLRLRHTAIDTLRKGRTMKAMTCQQLGGPCDLEHRGQTADEVIKAQDQHLKDMVAEGDAAHEPALKDMKGRWKRPISGLGWYRQVKRDFAGLPEG
jgi:AhpD family alkylhydroperoxidase